MKVRHKPVVREAIHFEDTRLFQLGELSEFLEGIAAVIDFSVKDNPVIRIQTLEGLRIARIGDWIIKDKDGTVYPLRPEVFAKNWELT